MSFYYVGVMPENRVYKATGEILNLMVRTYLKNAMLSIL